MAPGMDNYTGNWLYQLLQLQAADHYYSVLRIYLNCNLGKL